MPQCWPQCILSGGGLDQSLPGVGVIENIGNHAPKSGSPVLCRMRSLGHVRTSSLHLNFSGIVVVIAGVVGALSVVSVHTCHGVAV